MKIVGMLRVRNEARWIERVIASLKPACDEIVMLDDHSFDCTVNISEGLGAIVHRSPFCGLDETRDKNWLLERVAERRPDWIVAIDGDEEIAPGGAALIRRLAGTYGEIFRFQVLYLWDRPDQIRVDGVYSHISRPSMFRYRPGLKFAATRNGGNFHCGNVPFGMERPRDSGVELLHWGYLDQADRVRKYRWYNQHDPNNRVEDGYRHMVIGDLFPAESQFKHAGPLELRQL